MKRENFLKCITIQDKKSCWEWQCALSKKGYGSCSTKTGSTTAHRLSYIFFRGRVPKKMVIDHLCRNRKCVNPNHLEIVTNKENILRGFGACATYARQTHCMRGHQYDSGNMVMRKDKKGTERVCIICERIRAKKYREENPDKIKSYQQRYEKKRKLI